MANPLKTLFENFSRYLSPSTGVGGAAITTSNTTADPAGPFRALWVAAPGDIKITGLDDSVFTIPNFPGGMLSVGAKMIWTTGTTVTSPNTNIVGIL